jgi:hypothetical protein
MFRSITAVLLGVFVTFVIETLVVFGIMGPLFEAFMDQSPAVGAVWGAVLLVVPVAFSFYFGGMAAGYRATTRHALHGLIVVLALFVLSPALNLLALNSEQDPLPQIRGAQTAVLFAVAAIAATVGARRGKGLYQYNQSHLRRQRSR